MVTVPHFKGVSQYLYLESLLFYLDNDSGKCEHHHSINVNDVVTALENTKCGKADGGTCISTDHFKNGNHRLFVLLSLLFNSMLIHGVAPLTMLYSTVIPIPKDKRKSLNNSENYRAITLSSVLGKILDRIIMETQMFNTSDYQFGYKKNASTTQCTFVVDECINYYVTNDSSVYCVLLDASKAFDRVHFVKLFNKLLKCGICPTVCRLLAFMYTNQACSVRWDNVKSNAFSVHNGVKQGGVLSPTLFSIYILILYYVINELCAQ